MIISNPFFKEVFDNLDGYEDLARERFVTAMKSKNVTEIDFAIQVLIRIIDSNGKLAAQSIGSSARNIEMIFAGTESSKSIIQTRGFELLDAMFR